MPRKKSAAKKAREEALKNNNDEHVFHTKRSLDLSTSDGENAEKLLVNEEYAARFEHNKKREELDGLKEKHKGADLDDAEESSDSSEVEDEDDFGELLTEHVDVKINEVLKTIRENPQALLDKERKFFDDTTLSEVVKREKPLLLKDYHRQNYLEGAETEDLTAPSDMTYSELQKEEHKELIAAINEDEDDEGHDFLTKRTVEREVEAAELPDPSDEAGFLEAYLNNKAWIPKGVDKTTGKAAIPTYDDIVEDDEEFDDIADQFENAYNFRFEDPNAAEIVSYSRNQNTMRRDQQNSRKRQRERKKKEKKAVEQKRKEKITRLKRSKVKEVASKFEKLKQIIGDDDVFAKFSEKDLEGDFDDTEWDRKMMEVFNEHFYAKEDKKPEWDDDSEGEKDIEDEQEEVVVEAKPRKKEKTQEKRAGKIEKQEILGRAEEFVEKNFDLALQDVGIDDTHEQPMFRYREVSPESFGLTPRDILLADDKALNEYVGLKKLASFRDKDKKSRDKKKYAKKRRLREWRKSVFNREDEPDDDALIQAQSAESEQPAKKRAKKH